MNCGLYFCSHLEPMKSRRSSQAQEEPLLEAMEDIHQALTAMGVPCKHSKCSLLHVFNNFDVKKIQIVEEINVLMF